MAASGGVLSCCGDAISGLMSIGFWPPTSVSPALLCSAPAQDQPLPAADSLAQIERSRRRRWISGLNLVLRLPTTTKVVVEIYLQLLLGLPWLSSSTKISQYEVLIFLTLALCILPRSTHTHTHNEGETRGTLYLSRPLGGGSSFQERLFGMQINPICTAGSTSRSTTYPYHYVGSIVMVVASSQKRKKRVE